VPVSVNVSARSFQSPRLVDKIKWSLEEAEVSGDCLEIEITEATLMLDLERAADVLARLSGFGVSIAIDDFGTGYSSLSYLKRLPIHTLKIDQSFIIDVAFDNQDIAIVRSIIDLGHNLGYKVVAEGVESGMAWDMLNNLGCDSAQGFHVSHPLPEKHFASWLARSSASLTLRADYVFRGWSLWRLPVRKVSSRLLDPIPSLAAIRGIWPSRLDSMALIGPQANPAIHGGFHGAFRCISC